MKKVAVVLALVMLAIVAWGLLGEGGATSIIINGQELTIRDIDPLNGNKRLTTLRRPAAAMLPI